MNNKNAPLIEDKKIRKAIRAWAKINSDDEAWFEKGGFTGQNYTRICFDKVFAGLIDGQCYTIEELCGSEPPDEKKLWDASVISLDCGISVASEDYYEILPNGAKKTTFTWDEAMEIEKKTGGKWRVPSVKEWMMICAELGCADGAFDGEAFCKHLDIQGSYGYYWSSTALNSYLAYYLYFNSSYIVPQNNNNKAYRYSVRCVAATEDDGPREKWGGR